MMAPHTAEQLDVHYTYIFFLSIVRASTSIITEAMKVAHTANLLKISSPGLNILNSPHMGMQRLEFSLWKKCLGQTCGWPSVLVFPISVLNVGVERVTGVEFAVSNIPILSVYLRTMQGQEI